MTQSHKVVGVIGAGSFGTTIATLLAHNTDVLMYARKKEVVDRINQTHQHLGVELNSRIQATHSIEEVCSKTSLLFPVVPSESFRDTCISMSAYLTPAHMLIHATKGLDVAGIPLSQIATVNISRKNIHTMSEVIRQETSVLRVGCLAGPNLYREILDKQPAASVIASEYDEVIKAGSDVLTSRMFYVFGSYDLLGAEMAGALKNIIALGSGMLAGKGLGKNLEAMLITRGLREMIELGRSVGATSRSFLGTAGIGDLIATATSSKSRNFNFGFRLGQGENMNEIIHSLDEVVEGVRTVRIANQLAKHYHLRIPIINMIYSVVFDKLDLEKAIQYLMRYPYLPDVDFI
ncbi:MAG: NAD(P)-dependent glycerol-3-phosphate dehydrogenase [Saprospiraceae bacterium]|nr:NAD(P)-dependent glycerol-3-phosphate dehydrogenase [Saprospiraceae bacterium]MBK9729131.1 NAD(P)-dependent glycerol-3-phosphate dehydrogenase [Saprospiraceae bacterium]